MADENKPTDKIDLASTELKVGGVNLKGAYIVWFAAAVSAAGGSIYAAGQVWGEYQALVKRVDSIKMPDGEPVVKLIEQVGQQDIAITNLSQAIAANEGATSKVINDVARIQTLVDSNDVSKLQGSIATLKASVDGVQVFTRDVQDVRTKLVGMEKDMQVLKKDVDSTWNAIDTLGANSLKGR